LVTCFQLRSACTRRIDALESKFIDNEIGGNVRIAPINTAGNEITIAYGEVIEVNVDAWCCAQKK